MNILELGLLQTYLLLNIISTSGRFFIIIDVYLVAISPSLLLLMIIYHYPEGLSIILEHPQQGL
jgi:hypothetical protein